MYIDHLRLWNQLLKNKAKGFSLLISDKKGIRDSFQYGYA